MSTSMTGNTSQIHSNQSAPQSTITFVAPSTTNPTTATSYGQLVLPERRVIHIIPSQSNTQPYRFFLPAGFVFSSAISAMLQSQSSEHSHHSEHHIIEAFQLLASKVVKIDWPYPGKYLLPDQKQKRKQSKNRSKEKKKAKTADDLFDAAAFFDTVQEPTVTDFDMGHKEIKQDLNSLSPETKRLVLLRQKKLSKK